MCVLVKNSIHHQKYTKTLLLINISIYFIKCQQIIQINKNKVALVVCIFRPFVLCHFLFFNLTQLFMPFFLFSSKTRLSIHSKLKILFVIFRWFSQSRM
jgi:hypothetical protein